MAYISNACAQLLLYHFPNSLPLLSFHLIRSGIVSVFCPVFLIWTFIEKKYPYRISNRNNCFQLLTSHSYLSAPLIEFMQQGNDVLRTFFAHRAFSLRCDWHQKWRKRARKHIMCEQFSILRQVTIFPAKQTQRLKYAHSKPFRNVSQKNYQYFVLSVFKYFVEFCWRLNGIRCY